MIAAAQDRALHAAERAALTAAGRDRGLWFLKPAFPPATWSEALRVPAAVERPGALAAIRETRRLRACPKKPTQG